MSKDTFDAVLASTPVNRATARVMGKGEHWEPKLKDEPHRITFDERPPVRKFDKSLLKNSMFEDMTGRIVGRFTVIGLLDHSGNYAAWVVRCVCGSYETRRTKAIRNPNNFGDRCRRCKHLAFIKKRDLYHKYGKDVDVRTL